MTTIFVAGRRPRLSQDDFASLTVTAAAQRATAGYGQQLTQSRRNPGFHGETIRSTAVQARENSLGGGAGPAECRTLSLTSPSSIRRMRFPSGTTRSTLPANRWTRRRAQGADLRNSSHQFPNPAPNAARLGRMACSTIRAARRLSGRSTTHIRSSTRFAPSWRAGARNPTRKTGA